MNSGRIKLKAQDAADLQVLSACLQDALVAVKDMTFLPRERRFVLIANRFRWEAQPERPLPDSEPAAEPVIAGGEARGGEAGAPDRSDAAFAETASTFYSRVNCGLCIDRVTAVRRRNLDLRRRDKLLNLLALRQEGTVLRLLFAGDAEIRLEGRGLVARLEDLGEAWPTQWRPSHAVDEPDPQGQR